MRVEHISASAGVTTATSASKQSNAATLFWDDDCNQNGTPNSCDVDCNALDDACALFLACGQSDDNDDDDGIPDECQDNGGTGGGPSGNAPSTGKSKDKNGKVI